VWSPLGRNRRTPTVVSNSDVNATSKFNYRSEAVTQQVIDLIGEQFCLTGEWPDIHALQRDLERRGEYLDVRTAIQWIDINLGGMSTFPTATLTVRGYARHAGARKDLENFVAAVQLAYRRYASQEGAPTIGRDDFSGPPYDLDEIALRKLYRLLDSSFVVFAGGTGGPNNAWVRNVDDSIKDYRGVAEIADFLAVQESAFPARRGPRDVAREAEAELDAEREKAADLDRRRAEFRARWANRGGRAGYVFGMVLVSALIAAFLIQPATGGRLPEGALTAGIVATLLLLDYVLGLNARNVSSGVRAWIARHVEALIRRIQYPENPSRNGSASPRV